MLVQISLLAWLFLGETIALRQRAGLLVVAAGALIVQLNRPRV